MRLIIALMLSLVVASLALAQSAPETLRSAANPKQAPPQAKAAESKKKAAAPARKAVSRKAAKKAASKAAPNAAPKAAPKAAAKSAGAGRASAAEMAHYAALPVTERRAIQSDLVWTGDYNGIPADDFGERSVAAVKSYQARSGAPQTGILTPEQRAALTTAAQSKQQAAGWRVVDDTVTGIRLAIPVKRVKEAVPTKTGLRWASERGEVQIETFRIAEPGTTLAAVFERQKKEPKNRQADYSVMRDNFFVVSGVQGLKRFYVRAHVKDTEVRGMSVMYDQAMTGIMDPITVAMSSRFDPFPSTPPAAPRKPQVDYATGIVFDRDGHVVTDRQATDGCNTITLAGLGSAVLIGETGDLALLRIYGVPDLKPAVLTTEDTSTPEVTVVGVADPQAQNGDAAVSTATARIRPGNGGLPLLDPAPAPGFSGAAVLDAPGRVVGMAVLKPTVVAGPDTGLQGRLVPAGEIRRLLASHSVAPNGTASGPDGVREAAVRVICVRK
jgi:peptidoglycan hydrolase-like protein with peptidoglycan-binding domain